MMGKTNVPSMQKKISRAHLIVIVGLLLFRAGFEGRAEDTPTEPTQDKTPIGQFLTISSPVDDTVYGRISRAALALQNRARQENRRGILVLEITPGSSQFHHIQGLCKFLTTDLPSLTTVAWVPETVRGNHVILALACQEIIMKPGASLGDIGLGKALELDEQSFIVNLVNRRHNSKLSEAIALGMADPQKEVIWVQIESGEKPNTVTESRVVLPDEFDRLLKSKAVILKHETIKSAGADGIFSGEKARAYNVLVMHTAQSRDEVASLYKLPREALRENPVAGAAPKAMLIRVDEMIEPILEQFVLRQMQRAVASGVNLLIFEIESPGGYLLASTNLANAIVDLQEKKIKTVAYVPRQALSGAAIISLGCDEIYMQPHAQIGDAAPIEVRPGGQFERAPEKVLSVLKVTMKSLAEKKKRPVAINEAMTDKSLEVFEVTHKENGQVWFMSEHELAESNDQWVKGRRIQESGRDLLLTMDGRRANVLRVAEAPVENFDELKQRLGIPSDVVVPSSARTWVDTLIYVLNSSLVTTLLFMIGIACIILELHVPSGFFVICAAVCFGLFFWSRFLGGTAGWLEVVLFLLGIGCIALEIFVVPGFGIFGVCGGMLVLSSLVLASQTFVIPVTQADFQVLGRSVITLSGAIVGVIVLTAVFSRFLPSMPFMEGMILQPPGSESASDEPRLSPEFAGTAVAKNSLLERDSALLGREGVAVTVLRPAGRAQIDDEFIDVVSEGPFISSGRKIEVVSVVGNRVVVREVS